MASIIVILVFLVLTIILAVTITASMNLRYIENYVAYQNIDGKNYPICTRPVNSAPDGDGRRWGWENNASCVLMPGMQPNVPRPPPPPPPPRVPPPPPPPRPPRVIPATRRFPALPNIPFDWTHNPGQVFIDNGAMKIGFNMNRGSGIFHISESRSQHSLVNNFDTGRLIQQSFYGNADGSVWPGAGPNGSGRPWIWNPVQGGSYDDQASMIERWGATSTCFRSWVRPRHWATTQILNNVRMGQRVCLMGGTMARCRFALHYTGTVRHGLRSHELPAIFADSSLGRLIGYVGNAPWTGGALRDITPPAQQGNITGSYTNLSERWVAWARNDSDYALGIFFPHTTRITYYKVVIPGNALASCGYVAPIMDFPLEPQQLLEYDVLLAIGNFNDIRNWFSQYRQ